MDTIWLLMISGLLAVAASSKARSDPLAIVSADKSMRTASRWLPEESILNSTPNVGGTYLTPTLAALDMDLNSKSVALVWPTLVSESQMNLVNNLLSRRKEVSICNIFILKTVFRPYISLVLTLDFAVIIFSLKSTSSMLNLSFDRIVNFLFSSFRFKIRRGGNAIVAPTAKRRQDGAAPINA